MSVPVSREERVGLLDALRGFALFGVLAANLGLFTGRWGMPPARAAALPTAEWDRVATFFLGIFIEGKSYTLFSFLFGVGFAIYLERSDTRRWLRRLAVMFGIGMVHGFLIWGGDILGVYALAGLTVLLWRKRSDRTIVLWALVCFTMTMVVPAVRLHVSFPISSPGRAAWGVVQAATWPEAFVANTRLWAAYWWSLTFPPFLLTVVGRVLLGYVVGRRRLLQDAPAHLPFFRRLLWIAALVAVPCLAAMLALQLLGVRLRGTPWVVPRALLHEIATLAAAAVYLAAITLLYQRPRARALLSWLEPVGRMALTNYLSHSVICTLVFYGWPGLGLAGGVGAAGELGFAAALFTLQIVASRAWLSAFRFGPVEWLWRSLTYGKAQPMRRLARGAAIA